MLSDLKKTKFEKFSVQIKKQNETQKDLAIGSWLLKSSREIEHKGIKLQNIGTRDQEVADK